MYIGGSASEKYLGHQELPEDPVGAGKVEWGNPPTEDNIVSLCMMEVTDLGWVWTHLGAHTPLSTSRQQKE